MKRIIIFLWLALPLTVFSHVEETSFPHPRPGAEVNAICFDSINGNYYFSTLMNNNPHNRWELYRYNIISGQHTYLAGSGTGPALRIKKMEVVSGKIYALIDHITLTEFNLTTNQFTWSLSVDNPGWERINDFCLRGDTLFVGGDFSSLGGFQRNSLAALNKNSGLIISGWNPSQPGNHNFSVVKCLAINNAQLYVGGRFSAAGKTNLFAFNLNTQSITLWNPTPSDTVQDLKIKNGQLIIAGNFLTVGNLQARNRIAVYSLPGNSLLSNNAGSNGSITNIAVSNGEVFCSGNFSQMGSFSRINLGSVNLTNNSITGFSPQTIPSHARLSEGGGRLFVHQYIGNTFRVFCLSPAQPGNISNGPSSVCQGTGGYIYQVPPQNYVSQYIWSYSGQGASISGSGAQVQVSFSNQASSGNLTCVPISYCGTQGAATSLSITVHVPPVANAGPDSVLNCYNPQIILSGSSNISNGIYSWAGPQTCLAPCQNFQINTSGQYILEVQDPATGCIGKDTVQISQNFSQPAFLAPAGPHVLNCNQTQLVLQGNIQNSQTQIWWRTFSNSNPIPDPFTCTAPGNYFLVGLHTISGCKDSIPVQVQVSNQTPNAFILSHPDIFPLPADTLSCINDTIQLMGGTDTANVQITWKHLNSGSLFGNPAMVSAPGSYRLYIRKISNGCTDSSKIINLTQNYSLPVIQIHSTPGLLSCSNDSVLLMSQVFPSNSNFYWRDPNGNIITGQPISRDTGWHFFTATHPISGCSNTDSIFISYAPIINLSLGPDTLVCPGDQLFLLPVVTGNFANLTYLWSTGHTTSGIVFQADSAALISVLVNDNTGCQGNDSIQINPADPLNDSLATYRNCTQNNTGGVRIYTSGGVPPYQYQLAGDSNWQVTPEFNNLPFGQYHLYTRDSIGCLKNSFFEISLLSNPPSAQFLCASRINIYDTLVAVDVSLPAPDSTHWIYPWNWIPVFSQPGVSWFQTTDTGFYQLSMNGIFGDCVLQVQRLIYVSFPDTNEAGPQGPNQILFVSISPNPNPGTFVLHTEFARKQNAVVQVSNAQGVLKHSSYHPDVSMLQFPITLQQVSPGTYFLRVITEYDQKGITFTIIE